MSYRRAWMLADELNRAFAEPVVAGQVGGPQRRRGPADAARRTADRLLPRHRARRGGSGGPAPRRAGNRRWRRAERVATPLRRRAGSGCRVPEDATSRRLEPARAQGAPALQDRVGGPGDEVVVDPLQVAHEVRIERGGLRRTRARDPAGLPQGAENGPRSPAPRDPGTPPSRRPAAGRRGDPRSGRPQPPRRDWPEPRQQRLHPRPRRRTEKASPRFRRLAAWVITLRERMSPACSRLVVKASSAAIRRSSSSLRDSGSRRPGRP